MGVIFKKVKESKAGFDLYLLSAKSAWKSVLSEYKSSIEAGIEKKRQVLTLAKGDRLIYVGIVSEELKSAEDSEAIRNLAHSVFNMAKAEESKKVNLHNLCKSSEISALFAEGFGLSAYEFLHHRKDQEKVAHQLEELCFVDDAISAKKIKELNAQLDATMWARDLVNEPLSHMTAMDLAKAFEAKGKQSGFSVDVLSKKKIQSLKMGGLLAVNKGSIDPPTFSILEWKPKKARNKKPVVLVGKGVVYDTGGLSLKPTPNSMDLMKSDMAGAAMMAGVISAVAQADLDVHVIALIPASDNRPSGNAYVPGDIITMFDGTTVEVLNTDAEGRLLLADALSYAKKYDPQLVFDAATLTGAAVRAVGTFASAIMGTADKKVIEQLQESGERTYERVVPFPLWADYGKEMKSAIADLNNLGSGLAGQITAGKFLEHFTDYPWIHIDIAGPSFLPSANTYRPKGASGVGVRLLFDFLKNMK